ncbi:hypothetical protein P9112_010569 [Eukaryota sp. TZLM1-RC]
MFCDQHPISVPFVCFCTTTFNLIKLCIVSSFKDILKLSSLAFVTLPIVYTCSMFLSISLRFDLGFRHMSQMSKLCLVTSSTCCFFGPCMPHSDNDCFHSLVASDRSHIIPHNIPLPVAFPRSLVLVDVFCFYFIPTKV